MITANTQYIQLEGHYPTVMYLPDFQVKSGVPLHYLEWIGEYILYKKPPLIVHSGDFADMPSLSTYDIGKKSFEGRRYIKDIESTRHAMDILLKPIRTYNARQKSFRQKQYKPRMVLTLGNHEDRITRAIESDAKLDGTMALSDLGYEEAGWEVYPFLQPVIIDNIAYCHFFPRGANGRVNQLTRGAPNALTQVKREMMSCTSGHMQGLDFGIYTAAGGRRLYGLIAGSCYLHDENYMGFQGNSYWRGIVMKHEVEHGQYDPMFVSLKYLERKYG